MNDSAKIMDLTDSQAKDGLLLKEAQDEIDELTGQANVQIHACRPQKQQHTPVQTVW